MSQLQFCLKLSRPASNIKVAVHLGDRLVYQGSPHDQMSVAMDIDDNVEQLQTLRIDMQGKTPEDTKLDDQANIVDDVVLYANKFEIDGIAVDLAVFEHCVYTHNFNGFGNAVNDRFHGVMGCNGTVTFDFTTPIYIWLLENM